MADKVFPAWAGVDRSAVIAGISAIGIPRVGGGRPPHDLVQRRVYEYSPRGRG